MQLSTPASFRYLRQPRRSASDRELNEYRTLRSHARAVAELQEDVQNQASQPGCVNRIYSKLQEVKRFLSGNGGRSLLNQLIPLRDSARSSGQNRRKEFGGARYYAEVQQFDPLDKWITGVLTHTTELVAALDQFTDGTALSDLSVLFSASTAELALHAGRIQERVRELEDTTHITEGIEERSQRQLQETRQRISSAQREQEIREALRHKSLLTDGARFETPIKTAADRGQPRTPRLPEHKAHLKQQSARDTGADPVQRVQQLVATGDRTAAKQVHKQLCEQEKQLKAAKRLAWEVARPSGSGEKHAQLLAKTAKERAEQNAKREAAIARATAAKAAAEAAAKQKDSASEAEEGEPGSDEGAVSSEPSGESLHSGDTRSDNTEEGEVGDSEANSEDAASGDPDDSDPTFEQVSARFSQEWESWQETFGGDDSLSKELFVGSYKDDYLKQEHEKRQREHERRAKRRIRFQENAPAAKAARLESPQPSPAAEDNPSALSDLD